MATRGCFLRRRGAGILWARATSQSSSEHRGPEGLASVLARVCRPARTSPSRGLTNKGKRESPGIPGGWESSALVLRSFRLRGNDESGAVRGVEVSKCPGQERLHLSRPQIPRVLLAVKVDETFCPVDVSLLGAQAVVPNAQRFTHLVEQRRWLCYRCIYDERRRHVT